MGTNCDARSLDGPDLATGPGDVTWLGGSMQTLEERGERVGEAVRRIGRRLAFPVRWSMPSS